VLVSEQTLSRELRVMGYQKLCAWSHYRASAEGVAAFLPSFPAMFDDIAHEKGVEPGAVEPWFADDARIGQQNKDIRAASHDDRSLFSAKRRAMTLSRRYRQRPTT
jgi:hypothetical protein